MSDADSRLHVVTDLSPARWLIEAVTGVDLSVGRLVPPVFESYVRILHPA